MSKPLPAYTLGPWYRNTDIGVTNPLYRGQVCVLGDTPEGTHLSVVVKDDERAWHTSEGDTMRANARLIAAAPDLLEALERFGQNRPGDGLCFCLVYGLGPHTPACLNARAAIAKARGEVTE